MKIFLLEDDYSLNEAIKESLETENYTVESFYDGDEAYSKISPLYDIYILDINTPFVEGSDLIEKIKGINNNIKIIMISAIIDIEKIRECYKKGCDDYIKKPFDIDELLLKIEKLKNNIDKLKIKLSEKIFYSLNEKKIYINEQACQLTKREQAFLHLLISNKNTVVNITQIEDYVYGKSKSSEAIRSLVKRIRKKFPDDIIKTVREEGFIIYLN
ncbi:DNA-binding response regulator [Halarcobacter mediterraneus]|uniref:DNA-binding response regulator n=1 Tax=Halarcobacter mediterraneus TaxID=2023153 RepID=A0A4Q1AR26_9BACT|nr:response regulator transcription factor [Halarcobacter mediterraneus]RXK11951.1 DNA-binding response regulator [Halarcobacter mediterraneus]